ncbi:MAG TPA: SIS domain-containing protein [Armatimonadota bacterium]|jgi:D-sedoheptulose 7-phosphate isomerase
MTVDKVRDYLAQTAEVLVNAPVEDLRKAAELMVDAYRSGKQVFIMGNGGSAATASHLACDMQKTIGHLNAKKFRVMALTDNIPIMTAWANDVDYANVFVSQLDTWVEPGDLVIGISGSGNSPNVIAAMGLANEKGAVTVGMSGFDGGWLARIAQHNVIVPSENMQQIEDAHMVFAHLIFRYLLEEFKH